MALRSLRERVRVADILMIFKSKIYIAYMV